MYEPLIPETDWAAQRVARLPLRWQNRVIGAWERAKKQTPPGEPHRAANLTLLHVTEQLGGHRLPLDASDSEICHRAAELAEICAKRAEVFHQPEALHGAMSRICAGQGIEAPKPKKDGDVMPSIRRMTDPLWWRRQLRKAHAKNVEGAAIVLGLVNLNRDPYISNESLHRRQQQNERNAQALEATIARNELGQEYTLAELAAKGTANKAIRRAELMTRISGFERIARECGHGGLFFTMTCPSRMHKWRTVGPDHARRVIENPRYDETKPREAQAYLAQVWARIRASLKRKGIGLYGFRIAEPNHDGTPHWHLLVFHDAHQLEDLKKVVLRYALADSPNEPGAHQHRVDFKPIDWSRGTAAGYIAKYVAKNIDGYKVEKDLFGNDALETSARVEAWAATHGIRQFQQIGGAPVGVWRELRRVESVPEQAPDFLQAAHRAVNKTATIEGRDNACVAWDHYTKAQGGVFIGRDYRIRIATQERDGMGRYGEPLTPAPVGVETVTREIYTPAHMAWMKPAGISERVVHWFVESSRYKWEIVNRQGGGRLISEGPQAPWTCVNNCTEQKNDGPDGSEADAKRGGATEAGESVEGFRSVGQSPGDDPRDGWALHGAHDRRFEGYVGGIGHATSVHH